MHEMLTVVTDVHGVCQSVCHVAYISSGACSVWGHLVQPSPSALASYSVCLTFLLLFSYMLFDAD